MQSSPPFAIPTPIIGRRTWSTSSARLSRRCELIDALRGLAAIAVFASHAGAALSPAYAQFEVAWFDIGKAGIMVFFLCSGFIVPAALERYGSLRNFWLARVLRLYPLYWFALALTLLLYLGGAGIPWADALLLNDFMQRPIGTIVANLTMLQPLLGYPHLLLVSWSFAVQLLYYALLSALFVLRCNTCSTPIAICLLLAAILGESVFAHMLGVQLQRGSISYLASIFVGTAVYRAWCGEMSGASLRAVLALAMLMLVLIAWGSTTAYDVSWMPTSMLLSHLAAYVVFCLAALLPSRWAHAPLLYAGKISYSLLLMHPIVMTLLPVTTNIWLTLLLWSTVLYLVSSATYCLIEQPSSAFAGRILAHWHRNQDQQAAQRVVVAPAEVVAAEPLLARGLGRVVLLFATLGCSGKTG